ncbi:MAG: SusC/RagA family TonB-linked outer membrane protein, partial [Bacteroidota bacterium]|nr:SusC/RagA family TonB-linked outer membrane protein [Bacteroidota bacterium]
MKKLLLFNLFTFVLISFVLAQGRTVTGTVTSQEDGSALPGVNVLVQGTTSGTTTDLDGTYQLNVPENVNTLVFSFIGYVTEQVNIGNRSVVDLRLVSDIQQLTEVVVTALGVSRERKSIGYSVQEISGAGIAQAAEPNMVNALQGQIAGVQIQGTQGAIGGSTRITIRGVNSFLGDNQPLFVVDGMPINNDNYATSQQLTGFGGGAYDYGNAASDINSMDIETMSVLKGTAATALYGTRGANGVILITTKSGRKSTGIGIDVNSITTFETPLALLPHQQRYGGGAIVDTPSGFQEFTENGQQFFAPVYSKDGSWGPAYDPNRMVRHWDSWDPNSPNYGETRPWVAPANGYENFFETGTTLQNSIGLSSGNDQGNIRVSYTNLTTNGVMPNSNLARNTFSLNANYNLTDRLTIFTSGSAVRQNASGRNATGYDNTNPMQGFTQWWQTQLDVNRLRDQYKRSDGQQYTWNPTGIITNDEGALTGFDPSPYFFDNPYFVRNEFLQEDTRDRLFGNMGLSYRLAEGLSVSLRGMRDGFTFRTREAVPFGSVLQSSYSESTRTFNETNLEAKIAYDRQINENFSINTFIGGNLMDQERNRISAATTGGLALPGFYNISNDAGNPAIDTEQIRRQINSVFGFASLGLFSTVFVDLSLRGDWSSTLPAAHNNFWYPSISTSFVFTELPVLANNNIISFGKLRAGYGTAGNDANPYRLQNVYTAQQPNFGENPRYTVPVVRNNPNLRPEFTHEFEVGLEMNFLRDRLGFDFSYYDRTTRDQIFSVASSAASGFNSRFVNAGSMRNSGIELMLRATPLMINDFTWEV